MIDKNFCMSRFLAFRFIEDEADNFFPGLTHTVWRRPPDGALAAVDSVEEVERAARAEIERFYVEGRTAVFLSGGIDSAILASLLPKGTKAYTFRCVAEGAVDETARAAAYARAYGLDHEIVDMTWADFEALTPELLKADGVPFHSIEVQLLKAARHAKAAGFDRLVLGDGADTLFGGLDGFLSADRTLEAFYDRFAYVKPERALRKPVDVRDVYRRFLTSAGFVDAEAYVHDVFAVESTCSYMHAFALAGVSTCAPYCAMRLVRPLDLARIRRGEPKYLLRELFAKRFPGVPVPAKIPLPRATAQWFANWEGPRRAEFVPGCHVGMSGDQKWLVWCLEQFLDAYERGLLA